MKNRLEVLRPAAAGNYYQAFDLVRPALLDKLREGKVLIRNWHALAWKNEEQIKKRRGVDERGAESGEAYTREVLGDISNTSNLLDKKCGQDARTKACGFLRKCAPLPLC